MEIENIELEINISDNSAKEFANDIIHSLQNVYDNMSTHSMNDTALVLQGRKQMLGEILDYLKYII